MILVTGATGFLGAYIIKALVEKGHAVRGMKNRSPLPTFIPDHILDQVEWVTADLLQPLDLEEAMQGVHTVIHSAAIVSFHAEDRKRMYAINVEGTENVVNVALETGVQKLIHISSVAALGRSSKEELVNEERKWVTSSSNTHYAITKHAAEMQVWRGFAEGLDGVILNPSTILGFGNWDQSSCAIFKKGYEGLNWYTDGVNGFVGVEDVAEVVVSMLSAPVNHKRFIVNAENISFQKLFTKLAEGFGKKPPAKKASGFTGGLAWRAEALRSMVTGSKPLLTRETATVAQSKTSFDNSALLSALPQFSFRPLEEVVKKACAQYLQWRNSGV